MTFIIPEHLGHVRGSTSEQWCHDQRILSRFAFSYMDPTDTLPDDYVEKIQKAGNAFSALSLGGQIAYSMTDLILHTAFESDDPVDVDAVSKDADVMYSSVTPPEETLSISRFTHLAGGYEAGYYSYLWSLAIVHDLETEFDQLPDGLMDLETDIRLKQEIFEPGKTRNEDESVRMFLGRDWNTDAYVRYLEEAE